MYVCMYACMYVCMYVYQHFQTSPQKPLGRLKPNFMWNPFWDGGTKVCSNGYVISGAVSYPNHTVSWASLLGSLPVLSAHSFASNWQLLFLNQRKRENGRRNAFITKSPRKNVPDVGIELGAGCMPSGHASDRVTAPCQQMGKVIRPFRWHQNFVSFGTVCPWHGAIYMY